MDPLLPKRVTPSHEKTNKPSAVPAGSNPFTPQPSHSLGAGMTDWYASISAVELLLFRDAAADVSQPIEDLLNSATEPNKKLLVILAVVDLLNRRERFKEALALLMRAADWPENREMQLWFASTRVRLHLQLNQPEEAWRVTESLLPRPGNERPEDIGVYLQWLTGMMELNQWVRWREMKPKIERFVGEAVQQNPVLILSALEKTYSTYLNNGCLRETRVVQRLALHAVQKLEKRDKQAPPNERNNLKRTSSLVTRRPEGRNQRKLAASVIPFDNSRKSTPRPAGSTPGKGRQDHLH